LESLADGAADAALVDGVVLDSNDAVSFDGLSAGLGGEPAQPMSTNT
jgi:hypothetical protein